MFQRYILPLLAVLAFAFAVVYVQKNRQTPKTPEPIEPPIRMQRGAVLAGAGIVEPKTQNIAVGAPVPGIVVWVIGSNRLGQPVAKDETLFRLDDRTQKAELEVRKAMLATTQAQLDRLKQMPRPEEVGSLEAKLAEAKIDEADREDVFKRTERLFQKNATSADELRRYWFAYQAAKERAHAAQASLHLLKSGAWSADVAVTEAQLRLAQVQIQQIESELARLEVKALIDGELLQINVRPGEFVGAVPNQNLILIGNTRDLHVRVDVDEHDAPLFRPGLPARAYLRSRPDRAFPLEYLRVEPYIVPKRSLTGDNMERVDTRILQIIYKIQPVPENDSSLFVGQQVDVIIGEGPTPVARADDRPAAPTRETAPPRRQGPGPDAKETAPQTRPSAADGATRVGGPSM